MVGRMGPGCEEGRSSVSYHDVCEQAWLLSFDVGRVPGIFFAAFMGQRPRRCESHFVLPRHGAAEITANRWWMHHETASS